MSYDYNRIELIGHVGKEPEFSAEGKKPFACFSLATNRHYNSNGERFSKAEWHDLVCFGELAEFVGEHVRPGSHLFVAGELRYEKWEKDGVKHSSVKIFIRELRLLDKKQEDDRNENVQSSSAPPSGQSQSKRTSYHQHYCGE